MKAEHRITGVARDFENEEKDHFYPTPPEATEKLLEVEKFDGPIWECAAGEGHIVKVLESSGYIVVSTDLVDRGLDHCISRVDFLMETKSLAPNIITNPPFKMATDFMHKGLDLYEKKFALFLRLQALEGIERRKIFDLHPPARIHVFSKRITTYRRGIKEREDSGSGMMAFCWFVWEKDHKGKTELDWI